MTRAGGLLDRRGITGVPSAVAGPAERSRPTRRHRGLILAMVGGIFLATVAGGYALAGSFVYDQVLTVAAQCGGRFADHDPGHWDTEGTSAEFTVDLDPTPYLMPDFEDVTFPSRDARAVTRLRGQEMTDSGLVNDPRLAATSGRITLNADFYGPVASEWGTTRLENAEGAWEGTWAGASWNDGYATSVSGWLTGSGAYAGYTYYFHVYGPSMPFQVEGIIFEGSAPTS